MKLAKVKIVDLLLLKASAVLVLFYDSASSL